MLPSTTTMSGGSASATSRLCQGPSRTRVIIGALVLVGALILLSLTSKHQKDEGRPLQEQVITPPRPPVDPWVEIGIPINGQCHAMARLGKPREDGGWNTCLQPGLLGDQSFQGNVLKTWCNNKEWDCPWLAIRREQWPPKDCVVYSFGSNWDFTFEHAVSALGCKVHTFDPTMPAFTKDGWDKKISALTNIEFHAIGLGGKDEEKNAAGWKMMTLGKIMNMLDTKRLEILKVDIELGEWEFFDWLFFQSQLLRQDTVRQIMVEIHYSNIRDPDMSLTPLPDEDIKRLNRVMSMFGKFGFKLWARDENPYCRPLIVGDKTIRGCCDLSYIRTELKWE